MNSLPVELGVVRVAAVQVGLVPTLDVLRVVGVTEEPGVPFRVGVPVQDAAAVGELARDRQGDSFGPGPPGNCFGMSQTRSVPSVAGQIACRPSRVKEPRVSQTWGTS